LTGDNSVLSEYTRYLQAIQPLCPIYVTKRGNDNDFVLSTGDNIVSANRHYIQETIRQPEGFFHNIFGRRAQVVPIQRTSHIVYTINLLNYTFCYVTLYQSNYTFTFHPYPPIASGRGGKPAKNGKAKNGKAKNGKAKNDVDST
jgi:hypothetical protein